MPDCNFLCTEIVAWFQYWFFWVPETKTMMEMLLSLRAGQPPKSKWAKGIAPDTCLAQHLASRSRHSSYLWRTTSTRKVYEGRFLSVQWLWDLFGIFCTQHCMQSTTGRDSLRSTPSKQLCQVFSCTAPVAASSVISTSFCNSLASCQIVML